MLKVEIGQKLQIEGNGPGAISSDKLSITVEIDQSQRVLAKKHLYILLENESRESVAKFLKIVMGEDQ